MSDFSIVNGNSSIYPGQSDSGVVFNVIDGDLQFCGGAEQLRQQIRNLLVTWTQQWFLDALYGINYNLAFQSSSYLNLTPELQSKVLAIQGVSKITFTEIIVVPTNGVNILNITMEVIGNGQLLTVNVKQGGF